MRIYPLKNKSTLRIQNKASEFLKAYSSNSLDKPRNAFLNIKGQIVAVFDQLILNDEEALIVIEKQYLERLMNHLRKYLQLTDTTFSDENLNVYYDLDGDFKEGKGEYIILERKGSLILTYRNISSNVTDEEFTLFRLKNNIPFQGIDYDEELLLNVGDEEFVSYTKGCYLGQEIIARVHHRSSPPKKLVVRSDVDCSADESARMSSKTYDPDMKTYLGFLFVVK